MNEITRYRLIGSIFLLSLAAIFVPMVFDAPAPERDSDFLIDQEEETAAAAQNDDSQWLAPQQEGGRTDRRVETTRR
jgi:cell division septation protein DedD